MRPIRLTMQAFGPYGGREVVDFRDAMAAGLFGIYGQTGSGKSTIFAAMHFALFGEATKSDQEPASFRSDHADPALPTEVEFVFDVGPKRFVVRRRPDQTRPKHRGTGDTRDPHEAWIFDASGMQLDTITDANSGRVMAERKTGAVHEAVIDLLGYGSEQFRQIVLLPQGKFETFLTAKTEHRLAILRELFDVSLYRRLSSKLLDESIIIQRKIRDDRQLCTGRLLAEGFESVDALDGGVTAAEVVIAQEIEKEIEAGKALAHERAQLECARQREALFVRAENSEKALNALLDREDEIELIRQRMANAKHAQAMTDVQLQLSEMQAELGKAETLQTEAAKLAQAAATLAQTTAGTFAREKAQEGEIDALARQGEALDRYRQILEASVVLKNAAEEARESFAATTHKLEAKEKAHRDLTDARLTAESRLREARENEGKRLQLIARQDAIEVEGKAAAAYETLEKAIADAQIIVDRDLASYQGAVSQTALARADFENAENDLAAAQALHLAAKLATGEPCPVCGSLDHPSPVSGDVRHAGLDQTFRDARKKLESCQADEAAKGRQLSSGEATVAERRVRLAEAEKPSRAAVDLRSEFSDLKAQITALGAPIDMPAAEAHMVALDETIVVETLSVQEARAARDVARQHEAVTRDRLIQSLGANPEHLRQDEALRIEQDNVQRQRQARKTALEAAEKAANIARENSLTAEATLLGAKERCAEALARRNRARLAFETRLTQHGLKRETYEAFKVWIVSIDEDEKLVEIHNHALGAARRERNISQTDIVDLERPDLAPVEQNVQAAETALRAATSELVGARHKLDHLIKLRLSITAALEAIERLEAETAPLRELSSMFSADNPLRLDLETFAIGTMFDQVLNAANQRLGPMTSGRYTIGREVEGIGGRARRGLGIMVFDTHTGKSRSPSTLSGGETFIAALALALGLSDIVESLSGKVRLDTIFIDEGFGSLDTENESGTLDIVLQVLTHLVGQNRTVGLISHVPLVQEAVPAGFYVRKEVTGSRVELRGGL
ncbi:SMC family ATPase [Roseiarcaceae bacterium H3SJ34-1]|uniref:AAA family ATPase n=1 Tax=Terripilifer ovatus TaxID=3032367 RepID=UPI003AB9866A|nr:SMC family ATPase [Roseiarcaceae bacterium H3SJ34-1]